MTDHIIYTLYKNITKFIKFRGLENNDNILNIDDLEKIQMQNQKDKFNVVFDKSKQLMIVIVNDDIKLNSKLAEMIFKKYMTSTVKEVLIVGNMKFVNDSNKNNIISKMVKKEQKLFDDDATTNEGNEDNEDNDISNDIEETETGLENYIDDEENYIDDENYDDDNDNDSDNDDIEQKTITTTTTNSLIKSRITIRFCSNSIFISNLPKNLHMPKVDILTKKEIDLLFDKNKINKTNLPDISFNDPLIIWSGAKLGDIVKLSRLSEVTGIGLCYKLVV